jgi:hypothetical protein
VDAQTVELLVCGVWVGAELSNLHPRGCSSVGAAAAMTTPLNIYRLTAVLLLQVVRGRGRHQVSVWLEGLPDELHDQVYDKKDWLVGAVEVNDPQDGPLYLNADAYGPGWQS